MTISAESGDTTDTLLTVVGVGASAGGVEALEEFFGGSREMENVAFVVVTHMMADKPSMLPEIIARHTGLTVERAVDGAAIAAGRVYVLQPGQVVSLSQARLRVDTVPAGQRVRNVIDLLFGSLAVELGVRAVGVVLSGTGSDGALGCRAIREHGGLTIAQTGDGDTVRFSGMPASAIAVRAIDLQLPARSMMDRIGHYADAVGQGAPQPPGQEQLNHLCQLLCRYTGHDFNGYKPSTFWRRVTRRLQVLQLENVDDYIAHIEASPEEATLLFRDLLISVTSFFRDVEAFDALQKEVIPLLFDECDPASGIRVWVSGCATGEEAYSLAILLLEHAQTLPECPDIKVFATDIDEDALNIARAGRYPAALMEAVSPERRQRFFRSEDGTFVIDKRVRELCTFSPHSVLKDPPFSRIDLVSCRNLLIYLSLKTQDQLMPIFHFALCPRGYLFVGIAESVTRHAELFTAVNRKRRIFQRVSMASPRMALPLTPPGRHRPPHRESFSSPRGLSNLRRSIEARILREHAPAHVLINHRGEVVYYSPYTKGFLEHAAGAPSRQLLLSVRQELRPGLRRALKETLGTEQPSALPRTCLEIDGYMRWADVFVEPFEHEDGEHLYLVLFRDLGPVDHEVAEADTGTDGNVAQVTRELRDTREELYSAYEESETVVEELRLANEELSSVNEEMQSSNEELETSKEELQSLNEELHTVNQDLSQNIEALDQANAELRGLLESTQIATIFLDRQLAIRSFTPAATAMFNLIPSDRGRAITDIANALDIADFRHDLLRVLRNGRSEERATARKDGNAHYLMRIMPYQGEKSGNGGLLVTLIDVTALMEADVRHGLMIGELNHRVRNMLAVISAVAMQTLGKEVDSSALNNFLTRLRAMSRTYKLLTRVNWRHTPLRELIQQELMAVVEPNRFQLDGPTVLLNAKATVALGMTLHELTTNAIKHGALSDAHGQVHVRWSLDSQALTIHWAETGGPSTSVPTRRGFGSMLIDRQLAFELHGKSDMHFAGSGLGVMLKIPVGALNETVGETIDEE
ncbi:CheR family methyltransferase [Rhodanobacter sp. Col0626]|uniref:CheR family methyltransferase n=1 Tax=Rhodanobacter sp. Col0626 TaxID=3415679 RepID=UPI003CF7B5E2